MAYDPAIVKLLGGWRASIFAVLAVAALVAFLAMRGNAAADRLRADAAESRAQAAEGEVAALKGAAKRDDSSADATKAARNAAAARQPIQEARQSRVEAIAHEPRPAVPAVCPAPDARIVRESEDAAARIRAAEGRLRGQ